MYMDNTQVENKQIQSLVITIPLLLHLSNLIIYNIVKHVVFKWNCFPKATTLNIFTGLYLRELSPLL